MKSYEEYQKELQEEVKQRLIKSEELDDVTVGDSKPKPMDTDSMMDLLKGHHFKFHLEREHVKDYLIEARRISEKIFKRTIVNIDRGL